MDTMKVHPAASPSDLIQQVTPSCTGVVLGAGFLKIFECNVQSITPAYAVSQCLIVPDTCDRAGM